MSDQRIIDDDAWRGLRADQNDVNTAYSLQMVGLRIIAEAIGCTAEDLLEHREELRAMNVRQEW